MNRTAFWILFPIEVLAWFLFVGKETNPIAIVLPVVFASAFITILGVALRIIEWLEPPYNGIKELAMHQDMNAVCASAWTLTATTLIVYARIA